MSLDLVTVGVVCADVMVRPVECFPARGKLDLVDQLEMHVGGLAGVTAIVMCQLGGSAAFIGRLGEDSFGEYILSTLEKNGVDTSFVARDANVRTSASVVLISADGERTFLHHIGSNGTLCASDLDIATPGRPKVLHWGGPSITPRLDGVPMAGLFEEARRSGIKTSMDTCYDGRGVWLPLIEPSLPHLDVVFSSIEEARMYTGCEDAASIADFYQGYGVETVVVKLGAEGMYARQGAASCRVNAHHVDVVDTTGAGDASCAGFLYGYTRGWELERCTRLANAVGGLTVQHIGGAEAIQGLEEVLQLMEDQPCLSSALSV